MWFKPGRVKRYLPELLLIALGVLPLLVGLNNEIQEIDPAQYAEVARRIHVSGDWLHLHDNFGPFLNKPPLALWSMAVAIGVLGPTAVAARLPSLLAGLVLLAVVARIGARLWNPRTGVVAAVLLAHSVAFQLMVADPKVDMMLTCTIALTVALALEGRTRPWLLFPAWMAAGLAVLSKGPIGFGIPAVAVLPEALRRRWDLAQETGPLAVLRRLWALRPFRGFALLVLVALPFFWGVYEQHGWWGPKFLLWGQTFDRLLHRSEYKNHASPFFFVHTGAWAFLPFTPVLLWELARRAVALVRLRALPPDPARIVWWWLLIPFVAISVAEFKLPQYVYPMAPAAALISARALTQAAEENRPGALRVLGHISIGLGVLTGALAALLLIACFPPSSAWVSAGWLLALFGVGGAILWASRRWEPAVRAVALATASIAGFHLFLQGYVHPSLTDYLPSREFGALAKKEDPHGKVLPYVLGAATSSAAFHANRPAVDVEPAGLVELLRRGETRVAVIPVSRLDTLTAAGLSFERLTELPTFPTSRPTRAFLLATTRESVVERLVMVKLKQP